MSREDTLYDLSYKLQEYLPQLYDLIVSDTKLGFSLVEILDNRFPNQQPDQVPISYDTNGSDWSSATEFRRVASPLLIKLLSAPNIPDEVFRGLLHQIANYTASVKVKAHVLQRKIQEELSTEALSKVVIGATGPELTSDIFSQIQLNSEQSDEADRTHYYQRMVVVCELYLLAVRIYGEEAMTWEDLRYQKQDQVLIQENGELLKQYNQSSPLPGMKKNRQFHESQAKIAVEMATKRMKERKQRNPATEDQIRTRYLLANYVGESYLHALDMLANLERQQQIQKLSEADTAGLDQDKAAV